jgi:CheY-like chemotaxis protein
MTDPRPAPRRVLIVEDDDDVRASLHMVLEDDGWAVSLAPDGEAALEALRAEPGAFAVVLVDLMMPRLGGVGLLGRKAQDPAIAAVPVVVVSAIVDRVQLPDTGDVRAVLQKPVSIAALLDAVRHAAGGPSGARPATGLPRA